MSEPIILLEDYSPNGNATVIVEQDDRVVCLYLLFEINGERTMRSCWVRNLKGAPEQLDVAEMRNGNPSLMPEKHCSHPKGAPPLKPDNLKTVWAEEGDAVALYEEDSLLAVIPCWSGLDGFDGYARDCIGRGPTAWELGDQNTNACFARYQRAADYWAAWDDGEMWPCYRDEVLKKLEGSLGQHSRYFAIDGNGWPPKALTVFGEGTRTIMTSIGVSMRSQPRVELYIEDPSKCNRIELGACVDTVDEVAMKSIASYISGQTGLPWRNNTWLGNGHTLPADVFASLSGGKFPFALLSNEHPALPILELPGFRGDPVNLLWMIPISESERNYAANKGSQVLWDCLLAQRRTELGAFTRREIDF